MKFLIIAEKPSVASEIAKALGVTQKNDERQFESNQLIITSARGHLAKIDLPQGSKNSWELNELPMLPNEFEVLPIDDDCKSLIHTLQKTVRRGDVSGIVNACDAGREGELIFHYIMEVINVKKPCFRLWLQSMTEGAIRDAWGSIKPLSEHQSFIDEAVSRSEADWLVGINTTRALSKLAQLSTGQREMVSAGRVQTPTLALIVDRELAIKNFVPKPYWKLKAVFSSVAGTYDAWLHLSPDDAESDKFFDEPTFKEIVEKIIASPIVLSVDDEASEERRGAPKLFDLTLLQREANRLFGLSAKDTLDIAQTLYERHKVLSYPRTDSSYLPSDYVPKVKTILQSLAASGYEHATTALENSYVQPVKKIFDDNKITDHFAIIPTDTIPQALNENEKNIYQLVTARFVAAFFPPAIIAETRRKTVVANQNFLSLGKVIVDPGWMSVYGREDGDQAKSLAKISAGDLPTLPGDGLQVEHLKTKPPQRFNDGTLLAAMENAGKLIDDEDMREAMKEKGLGTPATRAATIEGLLSVKKNYLARDKQNLVPTPKAVGVIDFLRKNNVGSLTSASLTGEWEYKLRAIAKKTYSREKFMGEVHNETISIIANIRRVAPATRSFSVPCPKCGGKIEPANKGFFCQTKTCGFVVWRVIAGKEISEAAARELIKSGDLPSQNGFIAKSGKHFAAKLKLNPESFKVEFDFS